MNDGKSFGRFSHFALGNIFPCYTSGNGGDDDCGEGSSGGVSSERRSRRPLHAENRENSDDYRRPGELLPFECETVGRGGRGRVRRS